MYTAYYYWYTGWKMNAGVSEEAVAESVEEVVGGIVDNFVEKLVGVVVDEVERVVAVLVEGTVDGGSFEIVVD
jgi:hypothetical protein